MIAKLEGLRRAHSSWCADSTVKHGLDCTCGVGSHNAVLDEIISEVKELIASRDKLETAFEYADREARLAIEELRGEARNFL